MLNFALKYARMGLNVIPLIPKGKEPLIPWKEFQTRKATEEEIRKWFTSWPLANIGIVTGLISGVGIIDIDGEEGLRQAALLKLSSSLTSLTGNGKHLWFHFAQGLANSVSQIAPHVDIRGEGGYVVAPPSIHLNGVRYRWTHWPHVTTFQKLPEFPSIGNVANADITPSPSQGLFKSRLNIAALLGDMKDGNIDNTLFTVCSRLRADGYSADDARLLLQPHADRVGASPGHLDAKIENVWARYSPNVKPVWNEPNEKKTSFGQAGLQMARNSEVSGLVIHSPSNPESWEGYTKVQNNIMGEISQTGYPKLDAMLKGGLKSSRLFTVAARTGVGKTNWLLGVCRTLCSQGRSVLLFSTEMPYAQIWERYLATLQDSREFKSHKFYVCDSFAPNLERVEEAINEIKPDVFMFDHINHISEEQRELGSFMQGLNYLRRKYDCAGIVTAQLNRAADWVDIKTGDRVLPRMSMIKGSGTIEQASSRVLLLSETRVTPEMTEIVGNLDKNDNGPKGLLHFGLMSNPYKMAEL